MYKIVPSVDRLTNEDVIRQISMKYRIMLGKNQTLMPWSQHEGYIKYKINKLIIQGREVVKLLYLTE